MPDVARDILVQAAGTALGALLVVVAGSAVGVIADVPLSTWLPIGLVVSGILLGLGISATYQRGKRKSVAIGAENALRRMHELPEPQRTEVSVALQAYLDRMRWNRLDAKTRAEYEDRLYGFLADEVDH